MLYADSEFLGLTGMSFEVGFIKYEDIKPDMYFHIRLDPPEGERRYFEKVSVLHHFANVADFERSVERAKMVVAKSTEAQCVKAYATAMEETLTMSQAAGAEKRISLYINFRISQWLRKKQPLVIYTTDDAYNHMVGKTSKKAYSEFKKEEAKLLKVKAKELKDEEAAKTASAAKAAADAAAKKAKSDVKEDKPKNETKTSTVPLSAFYAAPAPVPSAKKRRAEDAKSPEEKSAEIKKILADKAAEKERLKKEEEDKKNKRHKK
jgi:hypothetical protein